VGWITRSFAAQLQNARPPALSKASSRKIKQIGRLKTIALARLFGELRRNAWVYLM
jgi:hypothetical protein